MTPRVVVVTREDEAQVVLASYGTVGNAQFRMQGYHSNSDYAAVAQRSENLSKYEKEIYNLVPSDWKKTTVKRNFLSFFEFTEDDIVVIVGRDGLVANTAKYLDGQPVVGVNPDPSLYEGVLVPHNLKNARDAILGWHDRPIELRTMVRATSSEEFTLDALNEIYIGHERHGSALYLIDYDGRHENHSSSGLIVNTGTGATGWARSIRQQSYPDFEMPTPTEETLTFLVREPWRSTIYSDQIVNGIVNDSHRLKIECELPDGLTAFGDGMFDDAIRLNFGESLFLSVSPKKLALVK